MSDAASFTSPYLTVHEAANLLTFGIAEENGNQQWRESRLIRKGLDPEKAGFEERKEIEEQESRRFLAAVKDLEDAARAGKCKAFGCRSKDDELLEEIPQLFWEGGEIDILGHKGGGAYFSNIFAHDFQKNEWCKLRFLRFEVEQLSEPDPGRTIETPRANKPTVIAGRDAGEPPSTRPGRPTWKSEIQKAYEELRNDGMIDYSSKVANFPAIREKITGSRAKSPGLGSDAIRKVIAPLFDSEKAKAQRA